MYISFLQHWNTDDLSKTLFHSGDEELIDINSQPRFAPFDLFHDWTRDPIRTYLSICEREKNDMRDKISELKGCEFFLSVNNILKIHIYLNNT